MLQDPITWYLHASGTEQAEAWVGLGTILLALATTAAVILSVLRNALENVRFEQGYAPILIVEHFQPGGSLFYEIHVSNIGYGPALRTELRIEGTRLKKHYKDTATANPVNDAAREVRTERIPFSIVESEAFIMNGGEWGFYIADYLAKKEAYEKQGLEISQASLVYHDRFGNEYRTRYSDFVNRQYDWIPPERFRKKGKEVGTTTLLSPTPSLQNGPVVANTEELEPELRDE